MYREINTAQLTSEFVSFRKEGQKYGIAQL